MKKTMRFLSMAALALVGAVMTGCTNDDNFIDEPQQPENKNNVVTMTTTVSLDGGSTTTRALTSGGVKTFATGETMALVYKNTSSETVKAVSVALTDDDITNAGKSATFTFELTNPDRTQDVTYIYPAAMVNADGSVNYDALSTQDGTLATLSSSLDLATKTAAWNAGSLPAATLENQLAILAITLKDNATPTANDITSTITGVTLSDGTNNYSVTRSATAGPIYVAIRPTSSANIKVSVSSSTTLYAKSLTGKTYAAGNGYNLSWLMSQSIVDLSALTDWYTVQNGETLTGTLGGDYKISIAAGATVMLNGVTINRTSSGYPGITCLGDATIIIKETNTVVGAGTFGNGEAGIKIGGPGTTLTIRGTGSLTAKSKGWACGIGGGYTGNRGNITIESGNIKATGGTRCAGIGGCAVSSCENITITGGTITAKGGSEAAGIGAGNGDDTSDGGNVAGCGTITISGGTVDATGGDNAAGIGTGKIANCGNITIGGSAHVTATKGSGAQHSIGRGVDGNSYFKDNFLIPFTVTIGGTEGFIATSPYTWPTP